MVDLMDAIISEFPGIVFRMRYSEEGAIFDMLDGDCSAFGGFKLPEDKGDRRLFEKYIAAEDRELFHKHHTQPRDVGDCLRFIFRFDFGDRIAWAFEKSHVVAVDAETGMCTYAGIIRDITDKMRLKEVINTSATQSHFFAAMSHELRTPLNALTGGLYMLSQTSLSSEQKTCFSILKKASSTLLETINEILDFSKLQGGGMRIVKKVFDIETLLHDVQLLFTPQAMEKKIHFSVRLESTVPRKLISDGFHIRQMLLNLVSNAFKFTSSGHITVVCGLESRTGSEMMLRFTVTDSGIGMSKDVLDNVFKPFVQANSSVSQRYKGTGLGLSIVKSLAEMLGGRVDVQSEKGRGSAFLFTCEATEVEGETDESAVPPVYVPKFMGDEVLLVEDNAVNRQIASFLLKDAGLRVVEAENGLEAVKMVKNAKNKPYSLILMDLQMPVLNGIQATRKIRALPGVSDIPIIAMTAHTFDSEVGQCMEAGMDAYISKPLDVREFYTVLSTYLCVEGEEKKAAG